MSKLLTTIASAAFITASLTLLSCSDNEAFPQTGKEGCPSSFEYESQGTVGLLYQGSQISQITTPEGSTTQFSYGGKTLMTVSFSPPAGVADGHGSINFTEAGENKIRMESSGEPSSHLRVEEIELNEFRLPAKITELGIYVRTDEGLKQMTEGKTYISFTYDPSTRNLLKYERFCIQDRTLQATYAFQYDQSPGTMSRIDTPAWFPVYWTYRRSYSSDIYDWQFLNYKNNIVEVTVDDKEKLLQSVITFQYTYNKNDYPIAASSDIPGAEKVSIRY